MHYRYEGVARVVGDMLCEGKIRLSSHLPGDDGPSMGLVERVAGASAVVPRGYYDAYVCVFDDVDAAEAWAATFVPEGYEPAYGPPPTEKQSREERALRAALAPHVEEWGLDEWWLRQIVAEYESYRALRPELSVLMRAELPKGVAQQVADLVQQVYVASLPSSEE